MNYRWVWLLCAWVLWGIGGDEFLPIAGFDDRQGCEERLKQAKPGALLVCLPDTVDPRGPKNR